MKLVNDFMVDPEWKLLISVTPGSHLSESDINKQLNDKERVAGAIENPAVLGLVHSCIRA